MAVHAKVSRRFVLAMPAVIVASRAFSQTYPSRPVTMVVTFAAGGGVDVTARIIAEAMGDILGQRVVIDNRGGGGTVTGTQSVVRAEPDGHTILAAPTTMVINPAMRPSLPFDWRVDLVPIGLMAKLPFVAVARPDFPGTGMKDLESVGRSRTQPLLFASGGTGTVAHLAGELFSSRTGVKMQHVPYRGEGPSLTDLLGGSLDVTFATLAGVAGQVQGGSLKALGVTTAERADLLPTTLTIAEQGYPGFDVSAWIALTVPKGTPHPIALRLKDALAAALSKTELKQRLQRSGAIPANADVDTMAFMAREAETWTKIVREAGIKADP